MKLIDDTGRLFGLINIIDFVVIVAALWFAGGIGWYAWKLHKAPKSADIKSAELDTLKSKLELYCKKHKKASICK